MLRNYLHVALRILGRHKGFTFINVTGLAVGMAAFILILLFVRDELSYDRFHANADRVYRLTQEQIDEGGSSRIQNVLLDPGYAPRMEETFPEVARAVRLTPVGPLLSREDRYVSSGHFYWTDPGIFDVFSIPLLAGNAATALDNPNSIVLSATRARALFGDDDPVGQAVTAVGELFTVTGVFADLPRHTHLPIDGFGPVAFMWNRWGTVDWGSPNYATYLLLADGAAPEQLLRKLPAFVAEVRGADVAAQGRFHLQSLTDIHLHSHLVGEIVPNGDIRYVYLFSAVALFILLIACINFMNLSTARSAGRAREVGMRKVAGARRSELVRQFLGESIMLTFFSLALAAVLVELALPFFNDFTGKELGVRADELPLYAGMLVALGLLVGISAGGYPALFLSRFRPAAVLKGRIGVAAPRSAFRTVLVVTQFAIAIVLIIGTMVVYRQLGYVLEANLGFDKEHVLTQSVIWNQRFAFDPVREQLMQHPDVVDVAQSNPLPSRRLHWVQEVRAEAGASDELRTTSLYPAWADAHFFPTYRIPFLAGNNFSETGDMRFILNASAVAALGWDVPAEAIDQGFQLGGHRGTIVGVVQDFHYESLHQAIAPMAFFMEPANYRYLSIRIQRGADLQAVIDHIIEVRRRYEPHGPISYSFLDEAFEAVYADERRLGQVISYFAGLAIFITCLGLFGMATFSVEQRTKEIGVRKVLGAGVPSLVALLSKEFVGLVLLALLIAAPIAYLAMHRWLGGFAYHVGLSWPVFLLAGLTALAVALLTVGYQTVRAALTDPVNVLRCD